MGKLALNKSTLNKEGRKVKAYKKFVPALDLKRKQLLAERAASKRALSDLDQTLDDVRLRVKEQLPMLSNFKGSVDQLVEIEDFSLTQVNLVGIRLPVLESLSLKIHPYSALATEHWLDPLVILLKQSVELQLKQHVLNKRLELLEVGLRKTTQRLNLFEKVLIPQAEENIRKIRIALSDSERAGVIISKIAKNKRLKAGVA
ncbi:MAG: V-type ATP synthase subunit D [Marinobacter sp.]|uniref:V-type ATP synthase subunit D n=1 Tax=Marinobacter sp. TaxID=50741 RepID=UPI001B5B3F82|nr:V-type ATP synthase subunit D [Marinobacter sp.]MBQ0746132.1 V-type ATP synthase subunit D [Marinobacter sp.]MBQ0815516.1 V-type ATP synthase subunit D [Marinobacter sp.]